MQRQLTRHPRERDPYRENFDEPTQLNRETVRRLLTRGYSRAAAARELGLSERHLRQILNR